MSALESDLAVSPARTVGERYTLGAMLGEGASATVYDAIDEQTGTRVAVKLLHPHVQRSAANVVRFEREVEILRRLAHPAVVGMLDCGQDATSGALFLVMERLEGATFDTLIEAGRPRKDLLGTVRAALPALFAAHRAGIVHRDLKPANLFVTEPGPGPGLRLLDFGIASLSGQARVTLTEVTVGTPSYMSPEQATTPKEVSPAADLWSVGVMMYRVIAGRLPFEGEGAYETVMRACVHPHPDLPAGAPLALSALVDECLHKSSEDRPSDARVVADRLDALLADPEVLDYLQGLDEGREPAALVPAGTRRYRNYALAVTLLFAGATAAWAFQDSGTTPQADLAYSAPHANHPAQPVPSELSPPEDTTVVVDAPPRAPATPMVQAAPAPAPRKAPKMRRERLRTSTRVAPAATVTARVEPATPPADSKAEGAALAAVAPAPEAKAPPDQANPETPVDAAPESPVDAAPEPSASEPEPDTLPVPPPAAQERAQPKPEPKPAPTPKPKADPAPTEFMTF